MAVRSFRTAESALLAFNRVGERTFQKGLTIIDDAQPMYTGAEYVGMLNFFKATSTSRLFLSGTFAGAPTPFPNPKHWLF